MAFSNPRHSNQGNIISLPYRHTTHQTPKSTN
jgi:hypothetical protein